MALLDLKVFKERTFYDEHFGINWVKKVKNSSKKRASAFFYLRRGAQSEARSYYLFSHQNCAHNTYLIKKHEFGLYLISEPAR